MNHTTRLDCYTLNGSVMWVHIRDITTGVVGWVRVDYLNVTTLSGC
jgi:hypothetical protein